MPSLLCLQHSSSPSSVRVPFSWLEMAQRSMFSAFDLFSGKVKLKTQGWVWVWMLWTPDLPVSVRRVILSHGATGPCSMFMPGSTSSSRGLDAALRYKVASVVTEPRAATRGTSAQALVWKLPLDPHSSDSSQRVVELHVDNTGHIGQCSVRA